MIQVLRVSSVVHKSAIRPTSICGFLDPEGGSQSATLVVVVVVVISSLKMPKAFLIRSAGQQNFAHTFTLIFPTDLPPQIFELISN